MFVETKSLQERLAKQFNVQFIFPIKKIDYYLCNNCSLGFYDIDEETLDLGPFYESFANADWYHCHRWEYDVVLKYVEKSDRVLEVGAGNGNFKKIIEPFCESYTGAELYFKYNSDTLEQIYDKIFIFQVIEHTSNPIGLIKQYLPLLKSGGELIVSVPNHNSFLKRFLTNNLLDQPPHHLSHWQEKSLLQLAKSINEIEIVETKAGPLESNHFQIWKDSTFGGKFIPNFMLKICAKFIKGHTILGRYKKI